MKPSYTVLYNHNIYHVLPNNPTSELYMQLKSSHSCIVAWQNKWLNMSLNYNETFFF